MLPVRMIVGLGNPGAEYQETRHNIGFMALDRLASQLGAVWRVDRARKAQLATGAGALLVKPQTFMNNSGECAGPLMRYFKWAPEQVLCVYDDISFPVGAMRLRLAGSAGGHNGMKSLIAHLGTERFPRLRVGIGLPGQKDMVGHVLGRFTPAERPLLDDCLDRVVAALALALRQGVETAANRYNVKKEKKQSKPEAPDSEPSKKEADPEGEKQESISHSESLA